MKRFYCDVCGTEISELERLKAGVTIGFDCLGGGCYERAYYELCPDCAKAMFGGFPIADKVLCERKARVKEAFGEGL